MRNRHVSVLPVRLSSQFGGHFRKFSLVFFLSSRV